MSKRGFSLLEVLVSLAILSMALVAITGISAGSFRSSNYAKHLTVATLLARSKLIDVEEELRSEGFSDSERTYEGDFGEEGYPKFSFKVICRPVEVDIGQMVGQLFGGDVDPEQLPQTVATYLGAFTGSENADPELVNQVADSQMKQMMGQGGLEGIFEQVGETLSDAIREVSLEVSWQDGAFVESVSFVEYVATTGRLAVPSGNIPLPPTAPAGAASQPGGAPGAPGLPGHRNPNNASPFFDQLNRLKGATP